MFTTQYRLHGKHAEMAEALLRAFNEQDESDGKGTKKLLFNRLLDIVLCAPLVGLAYSRKAPFDSSGGYTTVFADQIIHEKKRLMTNFRLIMLLDNKAEPDIEKRIDYAFRINNDADLKDQMDLYDSYVRGGVEVLYEGIIGAGATTAQDVLGNLMDFLDDYEQDIVGETDAKK